MAHRVGALPTVTASTAARMAAIRSKNTELELRIRKTLHIVGLRFRLHPPVPGNPDLVLPRHKLAVWVHGCFWHGHGCKKGQSGLQHSQHWSRKITKTMQRDAVNLERAAAAGWKVCEVWGCDVAAGIGAIVQEAGALNR